MSCFFKDLGPTVEDLHGSEFELSESQHIDECEDPGYKVSKSQTQGLKGH